MRSAVVCVLAFAVWQQAAGLYPCSLSHDHTHTPSASRLSAQNITRSAFLNTTKCIRRKRKERSAEAPTLRRFLRHVRVKSRSGFFCWLDRYSKPFNASGCPPFFLVPRRSCRSRDPFVLAEAAGAVAPSADGVIISSGAERRKGGNIPP